MTPIQSMPQENLTKWFECNLKTPAYGRITECAQPVFSILPSANASVGTCKQIGNWTDSKLVERLGDSWDGAAQKDWVSIGLLATGVIACFIAVIAINKKIADNHKEMANIERKIADNKRQLADMISRMGGDLPPADALQIVSLILNQ